MQVFDCQHCHQKFQVNPQLAGQAVQCPSCSKPNLIPGPAEQEQGANDVKIFACPKCSGKFQVPVSQQQQTVACPHCQSAVMVQAPDAPTDADPIKINPKVRRRKRKASDRGQKFEPPPADLFAPGFKNTEPAKQDSTPRDPKESTASAPPSPTGSAKAAAPKENAAAANSPSVKAKPQPKNDAGNKGTRAPSPEKSPGKPPNQTKTKLKTTPPKPPSPKSAKPKNTTTKEATQAPKKRLPAKSPDKDQSKPNPKTSKQPPERKQKKTEDAVPASGAAKPTATEPNQPKKSKSTKAKLDKQTKAPPSDGDATKTTEKLPPLDSTKTTAGKPGKQATPTKESETSANLSVPEPTSKQTKAIGNGTKDVAARAAAEPDPPTNTDTTNQPEKNDAIAVAEVDAAISGVKPIDHLLPPVFDVDDPELLAISVTRDDNKVFLPDAEGGTTRIDKRIVHVDHDGEKVSLVALSPEQRERRRFMQNMIVIGIGVALIAATIWMLLN
ncbi:MAG: hypothetical protein AAFN77_03285 [Planctomycetota bacterium]